MRSLVWCLLLCSLPTPVWAQGIGGAVYDAANHAVNSIQAARELIQIEQQIQDLMGLTDMAPFLDTVQEAADLINGIQQFAGPLIQRYGRWAEYIGQAGTLCNPYKLAAWQRAYANESVQAYGAAGQAKALFVNATQSLRTLVPVVQEILNLNGSVKGLQTLNGLVGKLLTRTVAMEAANTTFQESVQRKDLRELLEDRAVTAMYDAQRDALRGRKTCL